MFDGEIRGIIFDMDNTLVSSEIDFMGMKLAVYNYLRSKDVLAPSIKLEEQTVATLIQQAKSSFRLDGDLLQEMWEIIKAFEQKGMEGAVLEPGVREVLSELYTSYPLNVLTNNSQPVACQLLKERRIYKYFDHIVGRESMETLKPSPVGIEYLLHKYRQLGPEDWILIGDSWIDAQAAERAGVNFLLYQGDVLEVKKRDLKVEGFIHHMEELLDLLNQKTGKEKES